MHFFTTPHIGNIALLTFLLSPSISATPNLLQTRENPNAIRAWSANEFAGTLWEATEPARKKNGGLCWGMPGNSHRSAKAPAGYKCTIYSDPGCHGWRTDEFDEAGLAWLGDKMVDNGESWRCCKIGLMNSWGYCDAKLNPGTQ